MAKKKQRRSISNNTIAGVLVAALAVLGFVSILEVTSPGTITGHAFSTINATVSTDTGISVPVSNVDYGTMAIGDSNDTADDDPHGINITNDGNVDLNITIGASNLWDEAPCPTANYTFKCYTGESSCQLGSVTTWTNMPATGAPTKVIGNMNYSGANDSLQIEINITVPQQEAAGDKSSTITLTASEA